jgi:hypothetical protein
MSRAANQKTASPSRESFDSSARSGRLDWIQRNGFCVSRYFRTRSWLMPTSQPHLSEIQTQAYLAYRIHVSCGCWVLFQMEDSIKYSRRQVSQNPPLPLVETVPPDVRHSVSNISEISRLHLDKEVPEQNRNNSAIAELFLFCKF